VRTVVTTAMVSLALCACSDGADLAPGAGNDPGTGTRTLVVEGAVVASPRRFNARAGREFETEFSLRLTRDDGPVVDGTVTITSATGKATLTYQGGRWTGSAASYDEVYVLDVASGTDRIDAARVDGPDVHVFTQPPPGATILSTLPLTVQWSRAAEADAAALRTESIEWIEIADAGSYVLPPRALKGEPNRPDFTLRLARTNRLVPAGAAAGSMWSVTIENRLNVDTEPLPPL
jgi:hypothetical protein